MQSRRNIKSSKESEKESQVWGKTGTEWYCQSQEGRERRSSRGWWRVSSAAEGGKGGWGLPAFNEQTFQRVWKEEIQCQWAEEEVTREQHSAWVAVWVKPWKRASFGCSCPWIHLNTKIHRPLPWSVTVALYTWSPGQIINITWELIRRSHPLALPRPTGPETLGLGPAVCTLQSLRDDSDIL